MEYEILEHTADIKIKIYGNDFRNLLENAGHALSDLILPGEKKSDITREFWVEGNSNEQLLVRFLNELIYLMQTGNMIFREFDIEQVDSRIHAICKGSNIESTDDPDYDVKAATYHDLIVEETKSRFSAQVILDI